KDEALLDLERVVLEFVERVERERLLWDRDLDLRLKGEAPFLDRRVVVPDDRRLVDELDQRRLVEHSGGLLLLLQRARPDEERDAARGIGLGDDLVRRNVEGRDEALRHARD